jgi:hypothetical protein
MYQLELLAARKPSYKPRRLVVGSLRTEIPREYVPYIRLRGRWLQAAGFSIGEHVKVEMVGRRLMIEQVQ